jgi:hypothetical protein
MFDGYHKDNGFYQLLCLFGLFVIVIFIETCADSERRQMQIDWAIASYRLVRFLDPMLDRRLRRLNDVQNDEDEMIRDHRIALRAGSYRFPTDQPDCVTPTRWATT